MSFFKNLTTICKWYYLIALGLAIPYYLLLFGASGHAFSLATQDMFWMTVVILAFTALSLCLRIKEKSGLEFNLMRAFVTSTALVASYGALTVFLFIVRFKFGEHVGFLTVGLSYLVPLFFMFSAIVVLIDLFNLWGDGSFIKKYQVESDLFVELRNKLSWKRLAAQIIDFLIVIVATGCVQMIFPSKSLVVFQINFAVIFLSLSTWLDVYRQGTVGKLALRVKVVTTSGNPLTAPKAFIRNLSKLMFFLLFWAITPSLIGLAIGIVIIGRLGLHNTLSKCLVVQSER